MAGVLFIISVPTSDTEKSKLKNKKIISDPLSPAQLSDQSTKTNEFNKLNGGDTRDLLEIYEKSSTHSSRDTINSQHSKSNTASGGSIALITATDSIQDDGIIEINGEKQQQQSNVADGTAKKTKSCDSLVDVKTLTDERNSTNRKSWSGTGRGSTNSSKKEKLPPEKKLEKNDLIDGTLSINSTMEEVLRETLRNMKILNAAWIKTNRDTAFQIMFSMESTLQCENFLRIMNEWGIGEREGTSVSMMPCTFYHKPHEELDPQQQEATGEENKDSAWDRFLQSIRARLNVATIVEEVKKDASITFDFLCLVVIAAILAAFGLVENSTVFLVSSMLISPLMGPIIATIFGSVIKDYKLTKMGIVNELIGIFLATFVGFIFGLVQCAINDKYGLGDGVTSEMMSRCEFRSLAVGIFTALPSGAAVAIAILGENIGSLVGVAISASLLPPAVNAGVMWSLSVVYATFQHDESKFNVVAKTNLYSDHQSLELFTLGTMSMGLTIVNILCIYVMGVAVLKIKEVAPINSRNQKQFWKHDIKIARDYYKTCQNEDAAALGKKIANEIAEFKHLEPTDGSTLHHRKSILSPNQSTWSPLTNRNQYTTMQNNDKPPMQDLEELFHTITPQSARPITFRRPSMMGKSMSPPITNRDIYNLISHHDCDYRRPSHPFEHLTVHHCGSGYRNQNTPLDKIIENIHAANGKPKSDSHEIDIDSNATDALLPSDGTNKSRKFIVTPAADPLCKEE